MKSYFVNEAVDNAVNDYMRSKDVPEGILYNSFLVVVIRILINIYGQLDIITPYQTKSLETLKDNLKKYGATYFVEIQKCLIDLFNLKRKNFGVTESDCKEFFDLLYTPGTSNPLRQSYNFLKASNIYEVAEYYQAKMAEKFEEDKEEEKNLLGFDVYKLFNISVNDLSKMNASDIDNLNNQIYESLDISENAINKDYLLNEKIKEIKMQNTPITTGNGYVDILLIMSVIVTTIMVVVIFGTLVF